MVYAANNLKSYTDSIFRSLSSSPTDIKDDSASDNLLPKDFALLQNYPNPFNPTTTISYHIPQNGLLTLKVFDILGNEITTLVDNVMNTGYHTITFDGSKYSSGLYFARLTVQSKEAKPYNKTIKMLMTK
jgi:hypothetical protein